MKKLDEELQKIVDKKLPKSKFGKLNEKLRSYSFNDGFINKSFFNINSNRKNIADLTPNWLNQKNSRPIDYKPNNYEKIISIWKYDKRKA